MAASLGGFSLPLALCNIPGSLGQYNDWAPYEAAFEEDTDCRQ